MNLVCILRHCLVFFLAATAAGVAFFTALVPLELLEDDLEILSSLLLDFDEIGKMIFVLRAVGAQDLNVQSHS